MKINNKQGIVGVIQKFDENHEIAVARTTDGKMVEFRVKCLAKDIQNKETHRI